METEILGETKVLEEIETELRKMETTIIKKRLEIKTKTEKEKKVNKIK